MFERFFIGFGLKILNFTSDFLIPQSLLFVEKLGSKIILCFKAFQLTLVLLIINLSKYLAFHNFFTYIGIFSNDGAWNLSKNSRILIAIQLTLNPDVMIKIAGLYFCYPNKFKFIRIHSNCTRLIIQFSFEFLYLLINGFLLVF